MDYIFQADPGGNCCNCPARTSPCDNCAGGSIIYIQFKAKFTDPSFSEHILDIGQTVGGVEEWNFIELDLISVATPHLVASFQYPSGPAIVGPDNSISANTWYTIDLKLDFTGTVPVCTMRTDGTVIGSMNCATSSPDPTFSVSALYWGILGTGQHGDFYLDDFRVGTSDWGSSNLFAANNTAGFLVPPFDSRVSTATPRLSVVGGVLYVNSATPYDHDYLIKYLTFP